jgi:hypothetical protein
MPSIIGHEQGKAIVDENDKKSSFLFFYMLFSFASIG